MRCYNLVLIVFLCSCGASLQLSQTRNEPKVIPQLGSGPKHFLLVNTYDTRNKKFRENKKELFDKFIDSVLTTSKKYIESKAKVRVDVMPGYIDIAANDSVLPNLLMQHNATHAIVLNNFNVYFDQTEVETTRSSNGSKSKEAFYDIVSDLEFSVYDKDSKIDSQSVLSRRNHSSRSVASGLLAAGPNVVIQRKDAWAITERNLLDYLNYFSKMMRE